MDSALLIGINNYPDPNKLNGCVNDVHDVSAELQQALDFNATDIVVLLDQQATAANIKTALASAVGKLQSGSRFLFWYSGHGAQLTTGDAATDVICPVDFNFTPETSVSVDDFHGIFSTIPKGVIAAWGSDSCHSGDLERDIHRPGVIPKMFRPRPDQVAAQRKARIATRIRRFRDISIALPNIVLLAGCRSDQTSADAYINSRYNGAFTYYFLEQLKVPEGLATPLPRLLPAVQTALQAGGYSQVPQLSGPPRLAEKPFLGS